MAKDRCVVTAPVSTRRSAIRRRPWPELSTLATSGLTGGASAASEGPKAMSESAARACYAAASLPGLAPSQPPQFARREDKGEQRGHAEGDEGPDKEEGSAGLGDLAAGNGPRSPEMKDGGQRPEERSEEDDD